jgi:hypothetical protein
VKLIIAKALRQKAFRTTDELSGGTELNVIDDVVDKRGEKGTRYTSVSFKASIAGSFYKFLSLDHYNKISYSYFQLIEPQIFVGARHRTAPKAWFIYLKSAVSLN